jgi:hypothetical protein
MNDGEVDGEIFYHQAERIEHLVVASDQPGRAEGVRARAQQFAAALGGRFEQDAEP